MLTPCSHYLTLYTAKTVNQQGAGKGKERKKQINEE
jgi:hypothetical protein